MLKFFSNGRAILAGLIWIEAFYPIQGFANLTCGPNEELIPDVHDSRIPAAYLRKINNLYTVLNGAISSSDKAKIVSDLEILDRESKCEYEKNHPSPGVDLLMSVRCLPAATLRKANQELIDIVSRAATSAHLGTVHELIVLTNLNPTPYILKGLQGQPDVYLDFLPSGEIATEIAEFEQPTYVGKLYHGTFDLRVPAHCQTKCSYVNSFGACVILQNASGEGAPGNSAR
jgi:hypothetical protein